MTYVMVFHQDFSKNTLKILSNRLSKFMTDSTTVEIPLGWMKTDTFTLSEETMT